jgi:hypothetical protein
MVCSLRICAGGASDTNLAVPIGSRECPTFNSDFALVVEFPLVTLVRTHYPRLRDALSGKLPELSPKYIRINMQRRVVIVEGPLAFRMRRLEAARGNDIGLDVRRWFAEEDLRFKHLFIPLRGGFGRKRCSTLYEHRF